MTPLQKQILGNVLGAAVNAAVLFLKPELQPLALLVWGFVAGALGITKPGDSKPAEVVAVASNAVVLARSTGATKADIVDAVKP